MDHIQFPYRSKSHLALMHVVAECGAFERHNLDVDYDRELSRSDAHKLIPTGEVEFTSGNHVSTYGARARGDKWVYLGQSVSLNHLNIVTREDSGINGIQDIRGKRFASKGRHPGFNDWLYLKQNGLDIDKDDCEFIQFGSISKDQRRKNMNIIEAVKIGEADCCFLAQPRRQFAIRQGLKVIPIPPQEMVFFATVSTSMPFLQKYPDICKRLLMALLEGVAYFKQNKEKTIEIMMKHHSKEGMLDKEVATLLYDQLAPTLEPRLYPSMKAIANVYEEGKRQDKDAERISPLALWDFHLLREIDDTGFIDKLYKDKSKMTVDKPSDDSPDHICSFECGHDH
jgi:hypothetical protein